jgi:hypothetical protein
MAYARAHPVLCTNCTSVPLPGVKRPGSEADYSTSSSAEVMNAWRCISTILYVLTELCLIKHRDPFS